AIGDFNNDGKQDFATANYGSSSMSIRLGDGAGGFSGAAEFGLSAQYPQSLAIGDFNNDGKQDIAVAFDRYGCSVLTGDGAGGFYTNNFNTGDFNYVIAIGDFNRDGNQDLAVGMLNAVAIRLGNGQGGFTKKP